MALQTSLTSISGQGSKCTDKLLRLFWLISSKAVHFYLIFFFPLKFRVFFKIKSRNAHMKTHRQHEEQQRQKAQKAAVAAEMAATIARTTGPAGHSLIPLDHMSLVKHVENVGDIDDDVVPDLGDVMEENEVMDADLLLDDEDPDLLQDDAEL